MIDEKKLIEILEDWKFKNEEKGYDTAKDLVEEMIYIVNAQPQADKWIPCEVDMPKEMKEVLISRENSKTGTSVGYYNNVFGWYDQCLLRGVTDVIAWMPKPIEYKKEGNSHENT